MSAKEPLFRINFHHRDKLYELYAKYINSEELFGFISVSDLVFDVSAGVVIDPAEEQLKNEFKDVEVLHIPQHHVVRIEQVKQKKTCRIRRLHNNEMMSSLTHGRGTPQ
ncbi:hypothetical protein GCM10011365_13590 [Marinicella pacifica]|jgi:hypothetical protein|uniref:DUF1820 family protein n=1 Tax=Marinicella pacifica TaxID=1171543 RepID=A0A917CNY2_9GAMM|nr:DUF1820 family protein [Marinicella pacifica]GGF93592.1 hypothetical protein GCM10011365_13590 [Marinicella pacifica]